MLTQTPGRHAAGRVSRCACARFARRPRMRPMRRATVLWGLVGTARTLAPSASGGDGAARRKLGAGRGRRRRSARDDGEALLVRSAERAWCCRRRPRSAKRRDEVARESTTCRADACGSAPRSRSRSAPADGSRCSRARTRPAGVKTRQRLPRARRRSRPPARRSTSASTRRSPRDGSAAARRSSTPSTPSTETRACRSSCVRVTPATSASRASCGRRP